MMAVVTTGMASPLYDVLSRGLVLEGARPPRTYKRVRAPVTPTESTQTVEDSGGKAAFSESGGALQSATSRSSGWSGS